MMKRKLLIFWLFFQSLCVTAFSYEVVKHPDTTHPLGKRMEWAIEQAAGRAAGGVAIGYSFARYTAANRFIGSFFTDGPNTVSLVEILTGRKIINPFSIHNGARERNNDEKRWKETAVLVRLARNESWTQPAEIMVTDVDLPISLKEKTVIWTGKASVEESVAFLGKYYDKVRATDRKQEVITAIGVHDQSAAVIPVLRPIAEREASESLRGEAIFWIAMQQDEDAIPFLREIIERETSEEIIGKAMAGIHSNPSKSAQNLLVEWAGKQYAKELRMQAIFWLGQDGENAGNARLLSKLVSEENDPDIQEKAIFSLSQMKTELSLEPLVNIAKTHRDHAARKHAIFWLAQEASKQAKDFIASSAFDDKDTEVQKHAVFALYELDDSEGISELIRIAKSHPNPAVRKQAIFWLGESDDKRATEALLDIVRQ